MGFFITLIHIYMPTYVISKKDFIELLNEVKDDEVIVLTRDLTGQMIQKDKLNQKQFSFVYASDCFAKSGIGDFAFGKIRLASFAICKESDLTPKALNKIKK